MPMPTSPGAAHHLTAQWFSTSLEQRLTLARQRFFEEGERPSGLVPEPIIQSWGRMWTERRSAKTRLEFNSVTPSRLHSVLGRNQQLLDSARAEIEGLETAISGTGCRVLLTDARGVIVHATHDPLGPQSIVLERVGRVGVNISEERVGTSAPAIAAQTGETVLVRGAEHFYDCMRGLHCAAVPIRNVQGEVAGVLDLSKEDGPFPFDPVAMAGVYATMIENRLLRSQADEHLLLRFQCSPNLLDSPMIGLLGVAHSGRVVWFNAIGAALLGYPVHHPHQNDLDIETLLGCTLETLLAIAHAGRTRHLRIPSGLGVWVQAHLPTHSSGTVSARTAASPKESNAVASLAPPPPSEPLAYDGGVQEQHPAHPNSFADLNRQFIEQALAEAKGNISRAARTLGVSRGLLYRHLERWPRRTAPDRP